jgi:hypothetical protein
MGSQLQEKYMVVGHTYLKTEIKYMNPQIPKVKVNNIGVFISLKISTRSWRASKPDQDK